VHIDGAPFLWLVKAILKHAPNLETIQMIPTHFERLYDSHRGACAARGVSLKAGYARPELAWGEGAHSRSKHYRAQRAFMCSLAGPQKALFDELCLFGFEAAAMARRYYDLDDAGPITQADLAKEYGMLAADNSKVSSCVLAVLYYLDETTKVGDASKRRARQMQVRVERLRPYVATAAARERLSEELGVVLADDFPLARAETLRGVVAALRDGRLDTMRRVDEKGWTALRYRFVFDVDYQREGRYRTLAEVGDLMGVTRERVRQLEERALASLGIEEE
jgi:hypothetical protein